MTIKRRGAELVFTERDFKGYGLPGWNGRLLNPKAIDRETGRRASGYIATIRYSKPYGAMDEGYGKDAAIVGYMADGSPWYAEYPYLVTMQGHHPGGRRYTRHATLRGAQEQLMNWARRRFYIEEEVTR